MANLVLGEIQVDRIVEMILPFETPSNFSLIPVRNRLIYANLGLNLGHYVQRQENSFW